MRCLCGYLSAERCRLFAYGPADAIAIPKLRHLLPHLNPDWFYLSGSSLPRLSWKRGRQTGLVVVVACLVVTSVNCAETAEPIKMPFGLWTWVGPENRLGAQVPLYKGAVLGGSPWPVVMYRECAAYGRYSQPCLVDGSSDVAFHSQYCNSLFLISMQCCCGWQDL